MKNFKYIVMSLGMVGLICLTSTIMEKPYVMAFICFVPSIVYICMIVDSQQKRCITLNIDKLLELHCTGKTKDIDDLSDDATELVLKHLKKAIDNSEL